MDPIAITRALSRDVQSLSFAPPVAHVYNPLIYARQNAEAFIERYLKPGVETLLLGMNPGPYGMSQTGVPFGEIAAVRDWLQITAPVKRPAHEHPKRPILGLECPRSEVSGRRLWSWAADRFGTPDRFFSKFFVWNYCPLVFLEESGRNRTPDKLPAGERDALFAVCDQALQRLVSQIQPRWVLGVGRFAEGRAQKALAQSTAEVKIGTILHPSPASPMANRGWAPQVERQLQALGLGN